ncbi:hypothetical protein A3C98_04475 [Candidatus Roizmanbacteria bacterium RIFCSPHIGHO2_02_FULL_37_15]|nr:MAG: hypothetical protein A3C98_04475 [Candidatus Roizmanbacteria bacterium RIFCSPHIGHO2_02_FULL_37_15]OGK56074.1 MAG: hypothetical protein A3I50_01915 [Candidatus Roizmanbacteria bacterium RIFCSPLOWO2_02_FULL_37_9]
MDSKRILLVEDDLLLQKLYSDLLTSEHYYVETATDGMIAYQKMKEGGWDLVLLDIILPKLGGIEIVKKLKDEKAEKLNKNVVFLTNLEQGKEIDEIKKLDFRFLSKSNLTPNKFVDMVKSLL